VIQKFVDRIRVNLETAEFEVTYSLQQSTLSGFVANSAPEMERRPWTHSSPKDNSHRTHQSVIIPSSQCHSGRKSGT
jgi:hypothetical protein